MKISDEKIYEQHFKMAFRRKGISLIFVGESNQNQVTCNKLTFFSSPGLKA